MMPLITKIEKAFLGDAQMKGGNRKKRRKQDKYNNQEIFLNNNKKRQLPWFNNKIDPLIHGPLYHLEVTLPVGWALNSDN